MCWLQMEPVPTPLEATTALVTLVTQEMEGPVWTLMSALLAPTTVVSMQSAQIQLEATTAPVTMVTLEMD